MLSYILTYNAKTFIQFMIQGVIRKSSNLDTFCLLDTDLELKKVILSTVVKRTGNNCGILTFILHGWLSTGVNLSFQSGHVS